MENLRETDTRRQAQGQHWRTREAERVGVLLWAVGITPLAVLPNTGVLIPVHPPVFVGLQVVAGLLWLLVGTQCLQRLAPRTPQAPGAVYTLRQGV